MPSQDSYRLYGARGITVSPAWRGKGGFERFLAEVGHKPSPAHSLDRVDSARGYEPGNVRWATQAEQQRNRNTNRFIEANGERMCLQDWANRLGISHTSLIGRLRRGWDPVRAVTAPGRRDKRRKKYAHLAPDSLIGKAAKIETKPSGHKIVDEKS